MDCVSFGALHGKVFVSEEPRKVIWEPGAEGSSIVINGTFVEHCLSLPGTEDTFRPKVQRMLWATTGTILPRHSIRLYRCGVRPMSRLVPWRVSLLGGTHLDLNEHTLGKRKVVYHYRGKKTDDDVLRLQSIVAAWVDFARQCLEYR